MGGFKRTRILVAFEADLDVVPGWGHQPVDWINLFTKETKLQSGYNTTATVLSVEVKDKPFIPGQGYVRPAFKDDLSRYYLVIGLIATSATGAAALFGIQGAIAVVSLAATAILATYGIQQMISAWKYLKQGKLIR
jgi:hypothetical protein